MCHDPSGRRSRTMFTSELWRATKMLMAITALSAMVSASVNAAVNVKISELRADHLGIPTEDDAEEYVELSGPPGTSLDGLTYIVIGDGYAEQYSGVIEAVIPLTGHSIGSSGMFVIAQPSFSLGK